MRYVRARKVFFTRHEGKRVRVRPSEPRRDDDPLVQKHPQLFRPLTDDVEQASSEPGSRRRLSRPPAKKTATAKSEPASDGGEGDAGSD